MFQTTGNDIGDDLHVLVRVGREAGAGGNTVLVNHPQGTETDVVRVKIGPEGERVLALQPVELP